jgi:tetratricopeptide (TPR) repeat protein
MFSYIYGGQDRDTVMREARQDIDRALSLSPNSAEALTSAAMYELMFDDSVDASKAINFASRAIEANPNYSVAYHRLGQAYAKQSNYKAGLEAFEKARELDPLSASILNNVARLHRLLGDWKSAKATSLDNMRWNPNQPAGYIAVAVIDFDQGNFASSHSLAKDAQALNPEDPTPNLLLQESYLKAKMFAEAQAVNVNEAVYGGSNINAKTVSHIEAGDIQKARELIAQIEDDNVENTDDSQRAAYLYMMIRDLEKALELYDRILDIRDYESKDADIDNILLLAHASATLKRMNHPKTEVYRQKLKDYFEGQSPQDFERQNELWAGASFMASGDTPEEAYPWIDRMLDLGQADVLLSEIAFDNLRGSEAFKLRENRMNENRDRLRKDLETQRANPKKTWLPFN